MKARVAAFGTTQRTDLPGAAIAWVVTLVVGLALAVGCGADDDGPADEDTSAPVTDAADGTTDDGGGDADAADSAGPDVADTTAAPTDSAVGDVADAGDTEEPVVPPDGFPAAGLLVRIVSPGGAGTASTAGPVVQVGGVLFGDADAIIWQRGDQSGSIEPRTFWASGPITLAPGDNRVTVTATSGATAVSDTVTVTYNPAFRFDSPLSARPSVAWVGAASDVFFTIPSSLYTNADRNTVRLLRVDANGSVLEDLGLMRDNGALNASGDEIESDGVFTRRAPVACESAAPLYFRASVEVAGTPSYTAVSAVVRFECLERVPVAACEGHQALIDQAAAQLAAGETQTAVLATLLSAPSVERAGVAEAGGHALWVQFSDGVLGAVLATPAGLRGAGSNPPEGQGGGASHLLQTAGNLLDVASKRSIVLAPFNAELGDTDDAFAVATALVSSVCPSYELAEGTVIAGADASLARFRALSSYGVASISTHGEALFGGLDAADVRNVYRWAHIGPQEVLWTGSPVVCSELLQTDEACTVNANQPTGGCPSGTRCLVTTGTAGDHGGGAVASGEGRCVDETQIDLRLGRIVMTNRGYAVTPQFFRAWSGRSGYPKSLVNLGACRTMYNGTLASTFYAAGARAVTGFSGYVDSDWARQAVSGLFANLGEDGTVGGWFEGAQDPSNPGTWWRLFGAANLNLSNSELINGDFETGDATGWTSRGDGRVVSQLGSSETVNGKFMGLVSTGLGFTLETGTLEQTFCIPAGKVQVELNWKFYSEEFQEFCGSDFQDSFQAVLVGGTPAHPIEVPLVDLAVDDLCGYEAGVCDPCPNPSPCDRGCLGQPGCEMPEAGGLCQGVYNCQCGKYFAGLAESDIGFDQSGVYNTQWQRTIHDVRALAGTGPVTLRLFATDKGDSVFDTAILVDNIQFK